MAGGGGDSVPHPFGVSVQLSASTLPAVADTFTQLLADNVAQTSGNYEAAVSEWTAGQKREWWAARERLDGAVAGACAALQSSLGAGVAAVLGALTSPRTRTRIANVLSDSPLEGVRDWARAWTLACAADVLSEDELAEGLLACTAGSGGADAAVAASETAGRLRDAMDGEDTSRGPVLLVLPEGAHHMAWEAMPALSRTVVTRLPSLHFLFAALQAAPALPPPLPRPTHSITLVVNPAGDLPRTQLALQPVVRELVAAEGTRAQVWEGSVPEPAALTAAVTAAHTYVYCGHGSGERLLEREGYVGGSANRRCLLMGCSSGALTRGTQLEAEGPILSHLLAGAVGVVGNLWDVTDKDIDRYTEHVLRAWALDANTPLPAAVGEQRAVCRLAHAVGASPVYYGLPL